MNRLGMAVLAMALVCESAESAQAPTEKIGAFNVARQTDALTDTKIVAASTESSASDRKSSLEWRCQNSTPIIIYYFNRRFAGDKDIVRIQYRVDQNPPISDQEVWVLLPGSRGRAAFLQGDNSIYIEMMQKFTRSLKSGTKLLIEVTDPIDGESVRDTFSLVGLSAALKKLDCMPGGDVASTP